MIVRTLKPKGLEGFNAYLLQLRAGGKEGIPNYLLYEDDYSLELPVEVEVDPSLVFASKLDFASHLSGRLAPVLTDHSRDRDVGLWSWLALCFFDHICPAKKDGARSVGATYRYILSREYKNHYRHLIRTPCLMYHIHGKNARPLIAGKLTAHGEAAEQLASRQHLFGNRPLFEALDRLYITESGKEWHVKRGARGKDGGSMRRIGKVMRQFDLTYDFHDMTGSQILDLLPAEFDKYKKSTKTASTETTPA